MQLELFVLFMLFSFITSLFFCVSREPKTIIISTVLKLISLCGIALIVKGIYLLIKTPF